MYHRLGQDHRAPAREGYMGFTDLMWIRNPTLGSFRRIIRTGGRAEGGRAGGGRAGGGRAGCGSVCNPYRPGPAPLRRAPHRLSISVPHCPAPGLLRENSWGHRHYPATNSIPAMSRRSLPGSPTAGDRDAVTSFARRPRGTPTPAGPAPGGAAVPPPPARLPASTHHITDGGDVSDSH